MIWFDLDNSPHVPLFRPVFRELQKKKCDYWVTTRSFAQTKELLELYKIPFELIGSHAGKSKIKKVLNLVTRSQSLRKRAKNLPLKLAVSHGSRTQLVASQLMNLKSVLMFDYEYTESRIFNYFSSYLLAPVFIPIERLKAAGFKTDKLIQYPGFKEELYLEDFIPDLKFRESIGVREDEVLVVMRPPSMVGNYHESRSEALLIEAINYFSSNPQVCVLIVNRTEVERKFIQTNIKNGENIKFLKQAVDGLQLLYAADIAVSGGGTMNREAALLGTRTYSIFTGKRPYLDEYLHEIQRLDFLENRNQINDIIISKTEKKSICIHTPNLAEKIAEIFLNLSHS